MAHNTHLLLLTALSLAAVSPAAAQVIGCPEAVGELVRFVALRGDPALDGHFFGGLGDVLLVAQRRSARTSSRCSGPSAGLGAGRIFRRSLWRCSCGSPRPRRRRCSRSCGPTRRWCGTRGRVAWWSAAGAPTMARPTARRGEVAGRGEVRVPAAEAATEGSRRERRPRHPHVEKLSHPAMDSFGGGAVEGVRDPARRRH